MKPGRIEMFRKKETHYVKNIEKIQDILSSKGAALLSFQTHNGDSVDRERLNEKYQAYSFSTHTSPQPLTVSEVKAQTFLKKSPIIDNPDIIFKTLQLLQENQDSVEKRFRSVEPIDKGLSSVKARFKEEISKRKEYKKLIEEMDEETRIFAENYSELTTDVFIYKQQLINVYFGRVLTQLEKECKEKARCVEILWNGMVEVTEKMLGILLMKIEKEEKKQEMQFKSDHEELVQSIENVTYQTHKLKQKLESKEQLLSSITKPMIGSSTMKPEPEQKPSTPFKQQPIQIRRLSYMSSNVSTQTNVVKEKEERKKEMVSIGVNCKETRFKKAVSTQTLKELYFDINCVSLMVLSQKPKKTLLQEKETTKITQTENTKQEEESTQTEILEEMSSSNVKKGRISKDIRRRSSVAMTGYVMNKMQADNLESSSVDKSGEGKRSSQLKRRNNVLCRNSRILVVQEEQRLEEQKQNKEEAEQHVKINRSQQKNKENILPERKGQSKIKARTSVFGYNNFMFNSSSLDKQSSLKANTNRLSGQENSNRRTTVSTHSLLKGVEKLGLGNQSVHQPPSNKRNGMIKNLETLEQQIQHIIQDNIPDEGTSTVLEPSRLKEHIYSSFSKKISSGGKKRTSTATTDKHTNVCRVISQLYSMSYEKIIKGKTIEFVDIIFDYFAISYGAHNKAFVIEKVSCFMMEAKELEAGNIHVELFCLLAKLTKYPEIEDLCPEDFELSIRLLLELNCDKSTFHVQSNFTTVQRLRQISQPLISKCVGKSKAGDISKTMETLITRTLNNKEDKDNYRISVSSTILFIINRIAKQRNSYQRDLTKVLRIFRQPQTNNIPTSMIDVCLKYLNINKKLFINSTIKFRKNTKRRESVKISTFITNLMKIDYPLPMDTSKHLKEKYHLTIRMPAKDVFISVLSSLCIQILPNLSPGIIQNLMLGPTEEQISYFKEILLLYRLEEESSKVMSEILGNDIECIYKFSLEYLIKQ